MNTGNLKTMVRGAYDIQKIRIEMGNRIVGNFKAKLGQEPGEKEDTLDSKGKAILVDLRQRFKKLTDGVKVFPQRAEFKGDEVISNYTELCLIAQYMDIEKDEASHFRRLTSILEEYPIYVEFLKGVKGVGPAMAGVIISEIDITKDRYPSSVWKYAGLDVASDGRGRSRRKEHLVDSEYTNKEGEQKTKKGITFNPFLKTKLVGVLAGSFLKCQSPYTTCYYEYKNRLENHEVHKDKTKGHRHNMANRYMIKMFLKDLYVVWRRLEGLEVAPDYQASKLGHVHAA